MSRLGAEKILASFFTVPHKAPSLLRSLFRLQGLGLLTGREMAACALDLRRYGDSPYARSLYAQKWARSLNRACGVAVYRCGALPPPGSLLVANHRSYIDVIALLENSPCLFLVKSEVARWPVIGPAVRLSRCVPVDRKSPVSRAASVDAMARTLRSGASVCVFPEGTTTAGPGILPFSPGAFRMAAGQGIPVVPAAIAYEDPACAWVGDDSFLPHFARTFGQKAISASVSYGPLLRDFDPESLRRKAWDWVSLHAGQVIPGI